VVSREKRLVGIVSLGNIAQAEGRAAGKAVKGVTKPGGAQRNSPTLAVVALALVLGPVPPRRTSARRATPGRAQRTRKYCALGARPRRSTPRRNGRYWYTWETASTRRQARASASGLAA